MQCSGQVGLPLGHLKPGDCPNQIVSSSQGHYYVEVLCSQLKVSFQEPVLLEFSGREPQWPSVSAFLF